MAKRTITVLQDDLDGSDAAETVSFAVDGVSYEIDLNEDNAARLRDDFAVWTAHATRVGGRRRTSGGSSGSGAKEDLDAIRRWARIRLGTRDGSGPSSGEAARGISTVNRM